MKKIVTLFIILLIFLTPLISYAEGIDLDGSFDDWKGMPGITDKLYEDNPAFDILDIRWFPDENNDRLYLFAERLGVDDEEPGKKFMDWDFEILFSVNGQTVIGKVKYHPPSEQVDIRLEEEDGSYIWSAKGKWGEDKYAGRRVEFFVPVSVLTGSTTGGYEIKMFVNSGKDRIPDRNEIIISTVSTYAVWNMAAIAVILSAITAFVALKRRRKC